MRNDGARSPVPDPGRESDQLNKVSVSTTMLATTTLHGGAGRAEGIGSEWTESKPQMGLELGVLA